MTNLWAVSSNVQTGFLLVSAHWKRSSSSQAEAGGQLVKDTVTWLRARSVLDSACNWAGVVVLSLSLDELQAMGSAIAWLTTPLTVLHVFRLYNGTSHTQAVKELDIRKTQRCDIAWRLTGVWVHDVQSIRACHAELCERMHAWLHNDVWSQKAEYAEQIHNAHKVLTLRSNKDVRIEIQA